MLHMTKLTEASRAIAVCSLVVYNQYSQERLLGSGTDGPNMGFFYLIVDVAFIFNQGRSVAHFVRGKAG